MSLLSKSIILGLDPDDSYCRQDQNCTGSNVFRVSLHATKISHFA